MRTIRPISVNLLGPDIDHKQSLQAMLKGRVSKVTWLPDTSSLLKGRPPTLTQRVQRAVDQLSHTRNREFIEKTLSHLDQNDTDLIIAYWGTGPLADICAIKRMRPKIKVVLMVLCFPLALDGLGISRQHWFMRYAAPNLDGILYSNSVMRDYFHKHVFGSEARHVRELILKPCWPLSYQSKGERKDLESDSPSLIYVGRTDLSSHTVHAADDLRPLMSEILSNQIKLHHVRSPETSDGHQYRRPFEPLDQADLIAKMPEYDASLIAYNANACRRTERLEITVPDRLLTSVAAGVPVAIPSVGYSGSKEYLKDFPAVIEFESADDLRCQLADRERIRDLHKASWAARETYCAEAQGDALAGFLAPDFRLQSEGASPSS